MPWKNPGCADRFQASIESFRRVSPEEVRAAHPLRIGLSTRVTVDVRDDSGSQLAQRPRREPLLSTRAYDIDRSEIATRIAQIIRDNTRESSAQSSLR